ncbi:MAG: diguanylate cyclase [Halanaerobiales bacterium]|nr:diguanylate cyclase [Halanaerobiales bacterium]
MSLRKKTMLIIGSTIIGLLVVMYIHSQFVLLDDFSELEEQSVLRNVERALSSLFNEISSLNTLVIDNALWDDTCAFIENGNEDYLRANYLNSTFSDNNLNLVVILNLESQIVFEKGFDLEGDQGIEIQESFHKHLSKDSPLVHHQDSKTGVKGIVSLPQGPMLIASSPILTSDGEGLVRGTYIMGRLLDSEEISQIADKVHLFLTMHYWNEPKMTADFQTARETLKQAGEIFIEEHDDQFIDGYSMLNDIYGNPILLMQVKISREIYNKGRSSIKHFIILLIVSSLILGAVSLLVMEKMVLTRLSRLSKNVSSIGASGDLKARIPVTGNDEIASLVGSINDMMEALLKFQKNEERYVSLVNELRGAHQSVKDIVEFLPDATFVIDSEKKVIAWNKAIEEMTGVSKEEIIGKTDYAYTLPFYGYPRPALIDLIVDNNDELIKLYECVKKDRNKLCTEIFVPSLYNGKGASLWAAASPIYDSDGNLVGAIESIRDITARKEAEERLQYLSFHDSLTGLYNRTYFEDMMLRFTKEKCNSIGIIICDVDGLKLVNDTLGHQVGDKLLIAASDVLKASLIKGAVAARIGGDEFAILISQTDRSTLEKIVYLIRDEISKYNDIYIEVHLCISIGYATNDDGSVSLNDLFKEADSNMYREKLYHKKSNRSAIVQTLMQALKSRDFITEGHADRLEELLADSGLVIGLSVEKINNLRLLCQFHDLGKVGISDKILFKEESLTFEEFSEMKRHSEIGYRIAGSVPELMPISDLILKHHEWWNGEGYPLGLKGEEIPIECRLLSIADAYDVMSSERSYRKAMSQKEAICELRRCAGIQFDPKLVKEFIRILKVKKDQSRSINFDDNLGN